MPNQYRMGYVAAVQEGADLTVSISLEGDWEVYCRPSDAAIEIARGADPDFSIPSGPILLVKGSPKSDTIITYPLNTTATSPGFLTQKYERLRTITFEGAVGRGFVFEEDGDNASMWSAPAPTDMDEIREILSELPAGFVRDPFFGLGLNFDLRFLTQVIEQLDGVSDLRLRHGGRTGLPVVSGNSYVLSYRMFDETRRAIRRAHDKALGVAAGEKRTYAHNTLLTALDPQQFPAQAPRYRKDAIVDALGRNPNRALPLSPADRTAIVVAAKSAIRPLSRREPKELLELSREIEVVTLDALIERLRDMLGKKLKEGVWQEFFLDNSFVLRLAFSLPVMLFGDQVSVGGSRFSGAGGKVSDFAARAAATGNLSLIEIKTPDTRLLETTPYRGDLYAPTRELSGAVNQVLDQRYQLQKSISLLKEASDIWDIELYAIQCLVIAGRVPEGRAQQKSLELFRNGLTAVSIITFDELLGKLEHIVEMLKTAPAIGAQSAPVAPSDGIAVS